MKLAKLWAVLRWAALPFVLVVGALIAFALRKNVADLIGAWYAPPKKVDVPGYKAPVENQSDKTNRK